MSSLVIRPNSIKVTKYNRLSIDYQSTIRIEIASSAVSMEKANELCKKGSAKCRYIREISGPACLISHQTCFRTVADFKKHLTKCHSDVGPDVIKDMGKEMEASCAMEKPLSAAEAKLKEKYWSTIPTTDSAPNKKAGIEPQPVIPWEADVPFDEALPAIFGLDIAKAEKCKKCLMILKSERKISEHRSRCSGELVQVSVQHLMLGKQLKYFEVRQDLDSMEAVVSESMVEKMYKFSFNEIVSGDETPNTEVNALMGQFRCRDNMMSYGIDIATALASLNDFKRVDPPTFKLEVSKLVKEYINSAIKTSNENAFVKTHFIFGQRIHLHLGDKIINDYQYKISLVIHFLIFMADRQTKSSFKGKKVLSASQCNLVLSLKKGIECDKTEVEGKGNLELLHQLFYSILLSTEGSEIRVIPLFISCNCIIRDGEQPGQYHFASGVEISHVPAALLYLTQCVVVHQAYGMCGENDQSSGVVRRSGLFDWEELEEKVTAQSNRKDTGAGYVRFCMNVCSQIRDTEMTEVRFIVCQKHAQCGIMDGKEMSLKQLGNAIVAEQKLLWEMVSNNMLFGFERTLVESFWDDCRKLIDNFNEAKDGHWFGENPSNRRIITAWVKRYVDHLVEKRFITGAHKFCAERSRSFLEHSEKFIKKMLWLLQVTAGGPARFTEMKSIQIRNSREVIRNIFLENGRPMYVLSNHKGRDKMGGVGKPIARFPDESTGKLLLIYLVFIRPMEELILNVGKKERIKVVEGQELGDGEKALDSNIGRSNHLFWARGLYINERALKGIFEKTFEEHCGNVWKISEYRQYHAGVIKNFLRPKDEQEESQLNEVIRNLTEQSGHGVETANSIYGVSNCDVRKLDTLKFQQWRNASFVWHRLIGAKHEENEERDVGNIGEGGAVALHLRQKDESVQAEGSGRGYKRRFVDDDRDQKTDVAAALQRIEKKIDDVINAVNRGIVHGEGIGNEVDMDNIAKRRRIDGNWNVGRNGRKAVSDPLLLEALQKVLRNKEANFRSLCQLENFRRISRAKNDMLFILPTGSGKSLLFMIQPFVTPGELVVVIVPLLALQQDLLKKCKRTGLNAVLWKERNQSGIHIVICSCEHVVTRSYETFVLEQEKIGRISKVFIDEAHLLKQWGKFRSCLGLIKNHIRPKGSRINVFGLTATCPPAMEDLVMDLMNMGQGREVFRAPCFRGNISYSVEHITAGCGHFGMDVVSKLIKLSRGYQGKFGLNAKMIVYCITRDRCNYIHSVMGSVLQEKIFKYHAGMGKAERELNCAEWSSCSSKDVKWKIMVCTAAFGCGIDIPDVRVVVHVEKPRSTMSFLQESGRAGRDGRPAKSVVILREQVVEEAVGDKRNGTHSFDDKEEVGCSSGEEDISREMGELSEQFNMTCGEDERNLYGSLETWTTLKVGHCRRWKLDKFSDGKVSRGSCGDRGLEACDLCQRKAAYEDRQSATVGRTEDKACINLEAQCSTTSHRKPAQHDAVINLIEENSGESIPEEEVNRGIGALVEQANNNVVVPGSASKAPSTPQNQVVRSLFKGSFSRSVNPTISTLSVANSQSRSIGKDELIDLAEFLSCLCAVCSVEKREPVCHEGAHIKDQQKCAAYRNRCFRCSSSKHSGADCFTWKFNALKDGGCYSCSYKNHAKASLHPDGSYGKKNCNLRNSNRFVIAVWENKDTNALLIEQFAGLKDCREAEDVVNWLRKADSEGYLWLGDVLAWIKRVVLKRD